MPETKQLLRETRDRIAPPPDVLGGLERRRRHQENVKRVAAAVVAIVVALVGLGGWFLLERDATRRPADRSEKLGIFAPVSGRILYENGGADRGYGVGVWAVDPNGPADTAEGPSVADDVASTLVRLDLEGAEPLGWSSDGTELLLMRSVGDGLFPEQYLSILHADGSETRLNKDPMGISDATISPDGTRVVFAGQYDLSGLYVIDAEGGRPAPLPIPQAGEGAGSPRFSPDGTQIAYLAGNGEAEVWVANADGTDAHEILADEPTVLRDLTGLEWSPAGDRLAIGLGTHEESGGSIYTFAPDGSDFTKVIVGGSSPYWSPDGSQIAYTIQCDEDPTFTCTQFDPQAGLSPAGLAIADADGSNVRAFGFAASGPWHPAGSSPPTDETTPAPTSGTMWPQSSVEEVRQAQELADAGNPAYTWQVDPRLTSQESDPLLTDTELASYFTSGGAEIVERFLREELGWDEFLFSGEATAFNADGLRGLVYLRCAPGETNPLYPIAPVHPKAPRGDLCAPTIHELRYEAVRLDLIQPDRRGLDGIWVVNWTATQLAQADPSVVEAEATARLEDFLRARIDGEGAEGFVEVFDLFGGSEDVPLLYATTTGAPYERFEIELVDGPHWPYGEMEYAVRLFADGGETVVEQQIDVVFFESGRPTYRHNVASTTTTENGQPLPES